MNANRIHRLLKLITLLQSGRRIDVVALAAALGVSRRTVFRDLNLLEDAGVPYHFDPDRQSYTINDSFFLRPTHFTLPEALALLLVLRKFLSRQVHPSYQHALNAALKVESQLPAAVRKHCGEWLDGVSIRWPQSSPSEAISGIYETVQRALASHRVVRVRYDSVFDGKEIETVLEPAHLVFMSRGWYLIAWSAFHGEIRTFKMDRMLEVKPTGESFEPREDFSLEQHFGAAWRMIPEGKLYSVKLRFSAEVAASVEEVRWHESQSTTLLDDGRLLLEAEVDGVHEIASWVLGYGEHVEVLAPAELREVVRRKAARVVALADGLSSGISPDP